MKTCKGSLRTRFRNRFRRNIGVETDRNETVENQQNINVGYKSYNIRVAGQVRCSSDHRTVKNDTRTDDSESATADGPKAAKRQVDRRGVRMSRGKRTGGKKTPSGMTSPPGCGYGFFGLTRKRRRVPADVCAKIFPSRILITGGNAVARTRRCRGNVMIRVCRTRNATIQSIPRSI